MCTQSSRLSALSYHCCARISVVFYGNADTGLKRMSLCGWTDQMFFSLAVSGANHDVKVVSYRRYRALSPPSPSLFFESVS